MDATITKDEDSHIRRSGSSRDCTAHTAPGPPSIADNSSGKPVGLRDDGWCTSAAIQNRVS